MNRKFLAGLIIILGSVTCFAGCSNQRVAKSTQSKPKVEVLSGSSQSQPSSKLTWPEFLKKNGQHYTSNDKNIKIFWTFNDDEIHQNADQMDNYTFKVKKVSISDDGKTAHLTVLSDSPGEQTDQNWTLKVINKNDASLDTEGETYHLYK